jgi:hypothetical protein
MIIELGEGGVIVTVGLKDLMLTHDHLPGEPRGTVLLTGHTELNQAFRDYYEYLWPGSTKGAGLSILGYLKQEATPVGVQVTEHGSVWSVMCNLYRLLGREAVSEPLPMSRNDFNQYLDTLVRQVPERIKCLAVFSWRTRGQEPVLHARHVAQLGKAGENELRRVWQRDVHGRKTSLKTINQFGRNEQ